MRHAASPLIVELIAPMVGRCIAFSADPADCRLILQRLATRKRREAREVLDPATAAVILTEVDRFEKLIELIQAGRRPWREKSTSRNRSGPRASPEAAPDHDE